MQDVMISFKLLDKKIGDEEVAGLNNLWISSMDENVKRRAIEMAVGLATPKIVVGFANEDEIQFFIDCNWFVGGSHQGKTLVASDGINDAKFTGNIW